jgi:Fur family ferric uptake transcriptional regulator
MLDILQQLREAGLRATTPRSVILTKLAGHKKPVSIETIWSKVQRHGIDRVTVYRTMESLEAAGLVHRVDLGHGHVHYEISDPKNHHHHLVCESCGDIQDVVVAEEKNVIRKLEVRHKFKTKSHSFEMFGLCAECQ